MTKPQGKRTAYAMKRAEASTEQVPRCVPPGRMLAGKSPGPFPLRGMKSITWDELAGYWQLPGLAGVVVWADVHSWITTKPVLGFPMTMGEQNAWVPTARDLIPGSALEVQTYKEGLSFLFAYVKDPSYVLPEFDGEPLPLPPLPGLLKGDPVGCFD